MSESKYKSSSDIDDNTVLFRVLYYKIKNILGVFAFMYYLCEKYYKPITV